MCGGPGRPGPRRPRRPRHAHPARRQRWPLAGRTGSRRHRPVPEAPAADVGAAALEEDVRVEAAVARVGVPTTSLLNAAPAVAPVAAFGTTGRSASAAARRTYLVRVTM